MYSSEENWSICFIVQTLGFKAVPAAEIFVKNSRRLFFLGHPACLKDRIDV